MQKRSKLTSYVIIFVLLCSSAISFGQVPDDIDGRLWRLCKVWGFAKYYHEQNCEVNWSDLILRAIDSTIVSTSNASFNIIIKEMVESAGQVSHVTDSLVIEADINLNAQFDWIDDPYLSEDVKDILDDIRLNFRPGDNCLVKFNDYTDTNYGGLLSFSNDNILSIPFFSYSVESNRLLALFYYWNIINYFHADRNLMDQDWDSTLYQFIPIIREVYNDIDFHISFLKLVSNLDDSHGFTYSTFITNFFGNRFPLIKAQYIENQTVVTKIGPGIPGISVGDIVKKIDGIHIEDCRDSLAQFISASNENSLQRDIHTSYLFEGKLASTIHLELEDSTGQIYPASLSRNFTYQSYSNWGNVDLYPSWEITHCGYGYVNMGKLYSTQIPQMYAALKYTPGIIFDVRNYPNGTIKDLIPYLFPGPITYALLTVPELTYPGWYYWEDNLAQTGSFSNEEPYSGKIIILVNAITQSHAEYTVMGLQQHPNAFTIGSQTAGADGNVSNLVLPGYLQTYWTSKGIYYPDTTNAQRIGVRIDSLVTPTIQGIREGKDEVLAAVFDCLTSSSNELVEIQGISLKPNPANEVINVALGIGKSRNIQISAFNMLGQQIFFQDVSAIASDQFQIDVSRWMDGIYIVTLSDDNGIFGSEKINIQH